jgi:hypothetical protein
MKHPPTGRIQKKRHFNGQTSERSVVFVIIAL